MQSNWIFIFTALMAVTVVSCEAPDVWQSTGKFGCFLVGYTRKVSIPDCVEFIATTNACRGYCRSCSVSSNMAYDVYKPDQPVTSFGRCCNIMASEPVTYKVGCLDRVREVTFNSSTACSCHHCKKA